MGIFGRKEQRDDMHALRRSGLDVNPELIEGIKMAPLDRPHIFEHDEGGEILPASLLKAKAGKRITRFKGKTMRLGAAHSHDSSHRDHYLEVMAERPTDLLVKFRKAVQVFRRARQQKRDGG